MVVEDEGDREQCGRITSRNGQKCHIMTVSEWHKIENDGDPWQPTCWLQMAHNDDDICIMFMLIFSFLMEKDAMIILGSCASHPLKAVSATLSNMIPTPSPCGPSSSFPEKSKVARLRRFCPGCLLWFSLIPCICRRYRCISLTPCAVLPASYMVLTFHKPIQRDLVDGEGIYSAASFRLELLNFVHSSLEETQSSPRMWR